MDDDENAQIQCRLCGKVKNQLKYLFDAEHINVLNKLQTTFSILVCRYEFFIANKFVIN